MSIIRPRLRSRATVAFGVAAAVTVALAAGPDGGEERRPATLAMALAAAPAQHDHGASAAAPGPDSDAPAGAPVAWLPDDPWVKRHHLPYAEADLLAALGTTRAGLNTWLNRWPAAALVRRRGQRVSSVAARLVMRWRRGVRAGGRARDTVLRRRAVKTLTQRHLLQHLLQHHFHMGPLGAALPAIVGADQAGFVARRKQGWSLAEQGRPAGRSAADIERRVMGVAEDVLDRGVAEGWMPAAQRDARLAAMRAKVAGYVSWGRKRKAKAR